MTRRRGRLPDGLFDTEVEALTRDGFGVATYGQQKIWIDAALPGERLQYRFQTRRGRRLIGAVDSLATASPHRVEAGCEYFGRCGGCSFRHVGNAQQLAWKQEWLLEDLEKLGEVSPAAVFEPLTGPPRHYRRKARLGAKDVTAKGRVLVGFRERHSPFVTEMLDCQTLDLRLARLIAPLSELLGGLSIRARIPQIEAAAGDETAWLCLRVLDSPTPDDIERLIEFGATQGVGIELQPGGPGSVRTLYPGEGPLRYTIAGVGLRLGFTTQDFVQVNGAVNSLMVCRALELLAPESDSRVLDLFCGLGNFSLALATRAGGVVGVEGAMGLVDRARNNALANGVDNAEFHVHDLTLGADGAGWAAAAYDMAVVDPARSGAEGVLGLLAGSGIARVVYCSCNPETLARDAGILVRRHGYRLKGVGVIDMFPDTAHVESIALFER